MFQQPNQAFISEYAQEFAKICCDDIFKTKHFIDGKELAKATKVKQLNLFLVKFIFETWQAEISQLYSPYFNYGSPEVKQALNQLMGLLSKNIRITREDFEPMLQKCVEDTLIYLANPEVYFERFLEDHEGKWHVQKQLMPLAGYFSLYPDLAKDVFKSFKDSEGDALKPKKAVKVAKKTIKSHEVNPQEYSDIIQNLSTYHPVRLEDLWEGIEQEEPVHVLEETSFDLSDHLSDSEEEEPQTTETAENEKKEGFDYEYEDFESREQLEKKRKEVEELQRMLDEKESVKKASPPKETTPLTSEAEESIARQESNSNGVDKTKIEDFTEKEIPKQENTEEPDSSEITEDADKGQEVSPFDFDSEEAEPPTFEEPLQKESFEETPKDVEKATVPSAFEDHTPKKESESVYERLAKTKSNEPPEEDDGDEDSGQYGALLEKLGKKKVGNLRDSIALNQKFKFQNDLFKGDNAAFNDAIDQIDQCAEYKEAMRLIRESFVSKYDWDFSDETTVEFLNLVNDKY